MLNDQPLVFRKSSYSNGQGDCVEVADTSTSSFVRDSKTPDGATLSFPGNAWGAFVEDIKSGAFSA